ncbi:hypothetical protein [Actinoplanes sp. N902-109]|uniref:hypothetical protein n=1 Tax=Actinoplanes sp. (strain N902-109) TaxID=649831 RepID=UPI00032958A0|nr:hypothetical protein [Actinoplanes sp. N902-109]AGL14874.1 hypothetical protein L083_1364 [Actinoplanes sp. N902-109]
MRFFSNDAREAPDDQTPDDHQPGERPDRVQSEPVAVPGQRPPSPWATPADAGAPAAVPADSYQPTEPTDYQRDEVTEPIAYGAVPESGRQRDTGGVVESPTERNTTTYPGGTATTDQRDDQDDIVDVPLDDLEATGNREGGNDVTETALRDEGSFDDPKAVDPATTQPLETAAPQPGDRADRPAEPPTDAAIKDEGSFEDPQVVEAAGVVPVPVPPAPTAAPQSASGPQSSSAPQSASGSQSSGSQSFGSQSSGSQSSGSQGDTLFAAEDASGLKERWRDVQLRFVDSPKEATEEAAKLVEEAVDKLTASLKSRTGGGGEGDDTEALRVRLRGYRDVLDRILGL